MNTLEQFIAVYQPEGDKSLVFRQMLEQVIQEIKTKAQPTNEVIGMRDYFAGKAMQGLIGINLSQFQEKYDLKKSEMIAVLAYVYADGMMEARKAKRND